MGSLKSGSVGLLMSNWDYIIDNNEYKDMVDPVYNMMNKLREDANPKWWINGIDFGTMSLGAFTESVSFVGNTRVWVEDGNNI